jgi:Flp pilus assembly protein TadD
MELQLEPFRRNLTITEERLRQAPQDEELRRIRIRLLKEINTRELELYRLRSDRHPNDAGLRIELGIRLLRAGQIDGAIHELQTVRSDPRHQWRALLFLGFCFKSRNNWRLARRNFEDALKALPGNEENHRKEILFQLAQGCADDGDLATAVDYGHELANLDFAYRDIGRLLDEWQERMQQA